MKESDKMADDLRYEAGNYSSYIREENNDYMDFMNGDMERRNPFEAIEYGIRWACRDADPSGEYFDETKIKKLISEAINQYRLKHLGKSIGMFLLGFLPYVGTVFSTTQFFIEIKKSYQGKR